MTAPIYSVVVPCFNEQEVLPQTHARLSAVLTEMGDPYEIVYVNDGSRDDTLSVLEGLYEQDKSHVTVVNFSRNFGQQAASTAGMATARGRAVVLIDADLQDPPEVIPEMAAAWKAGADIVYGRRRSRSGESVFKKLTSALYYRMFRFLSDTNAPLDTGDFRLMDRRVCEQVLAMGEHNRYLRGMISWVGFKSVPVEFDRADRAAGETKYGLKQMVRLAGDGIMSFSFKPLRLIGTLGALIMAGSFIALSVFMVLLLCGKPITGLTFALAGLYFLIGGLFGCLGLMGGYLGRVYEEVRDRPLYIIEKLYREDEKL
ncbi:MAG: glycosyltransferase family 2 protein [Clostridia bacterium]|nr:glycosyltransferase family 2 protein [Clostridia bacterium]